MSVQEIFQKIAQVETRIKSGGIVISGGEPMVQMDFVTEVFKTAKQMNLKTTLETSGILFNPANMPKIDILLKYVDLVVLNIKHIDFDIHRKLTGQANTSVLQFGKYLSAKKIPLKITYVAIPNVNTQKKHLLDLAQYLAKLDNIKSFDVIPFRNCSEKYKNLNLDYKLKDIQSASSDLVQSVRSIIIEAIKSYKTNKII